MRAKIDEDYKTAMKAREPRRVATLRAINAALKNADIEARVSGKELADSDIMAVLQKMAKQREESLGIYEKAGRDDLATAEREELAIISEYLPKGMSEAEVDAAIADAIGKTGAAGGKDMGRVIAQLKADYPGRIDFSKASVRIKNALN